MSSLSCSASVSYSPQLSQPSRSPSPRQSSSSNSSTDQIPLDQRQPIPRPRFGGPRERGRGSRRGPLAGPSSLVRTVGETPEFTASTTSGQSLFRLLAKYRVPRDIQIFRPTPSDRAAASRPGRVALYEAFFKAGLRLPLPPFMVNLLDRYRLVPAQLVPNSIRTIVAFIVLCHREGVEATLSLFRCFYTLRKQGDWWSFAPRPTRALKLFLPSSVKGWKSRFFFADLKEVKGTWGVPDSSANKSALVSPQDRGAFDKLLAAEIPRCSWLLAPENLELAGLIPIRDEMARPDDDLRAEAARLRKREARGKRKASAGPRKVEVQARKTETEAREAATMTGKAEAEVREVAVEAKRTAMERTEAQGAPGAKGGKAPEVDYSSKKRKAVSEAKEVVGSGPTNKRPRSQSPPSRIIQKVMEAIVPIDLTAETPPEEERVRTPSLPQIPPEVGAPARAIEVGSAADLPTVGSEEAGPSEKVPVPTEAEAKGNRARAFSLQSIAERGEWVEEVVSQICLPEVQLDFLDRSANTFFQEAYTSAFWTANSVATLRAWFTQANIAMQASRGEAEAAQARARKAEDALEGARAAGEKTRETLEERLRWSDAEIHSQQRRLHEAAARTLEAEGELAEAKAETAEAEKKVAAAGDKASEAERKTAIAEAKIIESEAEIAKVKAEIVESAARANELQEKVAELEKEKAEAQVKAAELERTAADAIAVFRESPAYRQDIVKSTAHAYNVGFADCRQKVKEVYGLEGIESVDPDSPEWAAPCTSSEGSAA